MLILIFAHNNEIAFTTEIAFHVQLSFQEIKHVLWLTFNLGADRVEVDPGGLSAGELTSAGVLTLLVFFLLIVVLVLCRLVHDDLDALE